MKRSAVFLLVFVLVAALCPQGVVQAKTFKKLAKGWYYSESSYNKSGSGIKRNKLVLKKATLKTGAGKVKKGTFKLKINKGCKYRFLISDANIAESKKACNKKIKGGYFWKVHINKSGKVNKIICAL